MWLAFGEPFVSFGEPVDSLWAYSLLAVAGVVALYLLGWVMLGLSRAHVWLAGTLLGPTDRERRLVQLERARADVVDDSAATLRRVERDLHDGTQARLITVAMALARADEHLARSSDVPRARELVSDALANTKDTLTELRDLVRGIRPPALDLGLGPAVQTLAARNPIPVDVSVDLAVRPSIGVETMAYFCVAELLANVSRHSGASRAAVRIDSDAHELRITVEDNGSGGVQVGNGSGLTGLRDRLAMLVGIDRAGGPTIVTVVVRLEPSSDPAAIAEAARPRDGFAVTERRARGGGQNPAPPTNCGCGFDECKLDVAVGRIADFHRRRLGGRGVAQLSFDHRARRREVTSRPSSPS